MTVAALASLAMSFALAASAGGDRPPDWLKKPTPDDLISVWPVEAAKAGRGGMAVIECVVLTSGMLARCKVIQEDPPGEGFGGAALLLAPGFLMTPALKDGVPVEGAVAIPIRFRTDGVITPRMTTRSRIAEPVKGLIMTRSLPWLSVPTARDVAVLYPGKSFDLARPALVVFQCGVAEDGRLKDCTPISENPKGGGFAMAGKALTRKFQASVDGVDKTTLRSLRINLPIAFIRPDYDSVERVITRPLWTRSVDPVQTQALFPSRAAEAGLKTGRAVLDCLVGAGGALRDCKATSEDPAGMDFGPAAVRVGSALAVGLWTENGEPAEGAHVRFAIRFNRAETPAP